MIVDIRMTCDTETDECNIYISNHLDTIPPMVALQFIKSLLTSLVDDPEPCTCDSCTEYRQRLAGLDAELDKRFPEMVTSGTEFPQ